MTAMPTITTEARALNRTWLVLAGLLNELDQVLNHGDLTDGERLIGVRALYDDVRARMPAAAPASVGMEARTREAEQPATGPDEFFREEPDGSFAGPFTYGADDGAPFTPEQDAVMQADWERAHERRG